MSLASAHALDLNFQISRYESVDAAEKCIEALRKYRNLHPSFSKVAFTLYLWACVLMSACSILLANPQDPRHDLFFAFVPICRKFAGPSRGLIQSTHGAVEGHLVDESLHGGVAYVDRRRDDGCSGEAP